MARRTKLDLTKRKGRTRNKRQLAADAAAALRAERAEHLASPTVTTEAQPQETDASAEDTCDSSVVPDLSSSAHHGYEFTGAS